MIEPSPYTEERLRQRMARMPEDSHTPERAPPTRGAVMNRMAPCYDLGCLGVGLGARFRRETLDRGARQLFAKEALTEGEPRALLPEAPARDQAAGVRHG